MSPQNNGDRRYTQTEAQRYVKYLCCWKFANPVDAAKRRDPREYRQRLLQLIEINKSRIDQAGKWEIAAAIKELAKL